MVKTNLPSTLAASNNVADIRAIKAPVSIPNTWLWVACMLGALLAAALAWWLWRRSRRRRQTAPAPEIVVPPHERALAKLQEALALMPQPRPFCILVSDTIRVYLEERFRLHAPERTTEEFLEELQSNPLLTFEQKQTLGEFLMGCDLVKFARYEPGEAELRGIYDAAVRLVEETQPPPPVAEASQPAAPPATASPSP